MPLNDNQRRFIALYRSTTPRHATRAYEAVYKARGDAASRIASEYLAKPDIRAEIDALDAADLRDLGITAAAVLREIARLGFSDARQLYDATGALKSPHALSDEMAAAVASVEVVSYVSPETDEPLLKRTHKIRLWNKAENLKILAQYLKLITEKVQVDVQVSLTVHEQALTAAHQRAEELLHANGSRSTPA